MADWYWWGAEHWTDLSDLIKRLQASKLNERSQAAGLQRSHVPGGLRLLIWCGAAPWSGGTAAVHLRRSWLISHPALVFSEALRDVRRRINLIFHPKVNL